MSVTFFKIKRWYRMLIGKSVWHVEQNVGKYFSSSELNGYYNDLTNKVIMMPDLLTNDNLPQLNLENNTYVDFPVAIFQYGLGAYDLYFQTNDIRYKNKCLQCAEWALKNMDSEGRWNNFFYVFPDNPYGAMAQGEGVSLMLRAYKLTNITAYFDASKKAIDYMLRSVEEGGNTDYNNGETIFLECTHLSAILNGWIFAWWGLYDYVLLTNDMGIYKLRLNESLNSLLNHLPKFSCIYWSYYDLNYKIASPFYHDLHVAQMQAMYELTGIELFSSYARRWEKQKRNIIYKSFAFMKKVYQKIKE